MQRLEAFLAKSDTQCEKRDYGWAPTHQPELETARARSLLRTQLARYEAVSRLLASARKHLATLQGKDTVFTVKPCREVRGFVAAAHEGAVLIGKHTYSFDEMTASSILTYYRTASGAAMNESAVFMFSLFEGDLRNAERSFARLNQPLPERLILRLEALRRERQAERLLRAALLAKGSSCTKKLTLLLERYPNSRAAGKAREHLGSPSTPKETNPPPATSDIVFQARDLRPSALSGDLEFKDDRQAMGGAFLTGKCRSRVEPHPPGNTHHATFTATVVSGVKYRLWVRMKTGRVCGMSKGNLLFGQLSEGALVGSGRKPLLGEEDWITLQGGDSPGYEWVGTGQEGNDTNPVLLTFPQSGEVLVRIYEGMDGVGFDQIVLSSRAYLTSPPPPHAKENRTESDSSKRNSNPSRQ